MFQPARKSNDRRGRLLSEQLKRLKVVEKLGGWAASRIVLAVMGSDCIGRVNQYGRFSPVCWTEQGSRGQGIDSLMPQLANRTILV